MQFSRVRITYMPSWCNKVLMKFSCFILSVFPLKFSEKIEVFLAHFFSLNKKKQHASWLLFVSKNGKLILIFTQSPHWLSAHSVISTSVSFHIKVIPWLLFAVWKYKFHLVFGVAKKLYTQKAAPRRLVLNYISPLVILYYYYCLLSSFLTLKQCVCVCVCAGWWLLGNLSEKLWCMIKMGFT